MKGKYLEVEIYPISEIEKKRHKKRKSLVPATKNLKRLNNTGNYEGLIKPIPIPILPNSKSIRSNNLSESEI